MSFIELLLLAAALSMDSFSAALCKGLSAPQLKVSQAAKTGLCFGFFQALMPVAGYFLGQAFYSLVQRWDHWIAFALLVGLGIHAVREAIQQEDCPTGDFSLRSLLPLALGTSIDVLAVGVSLAFLKTDIWLSALLIFLITFLFSFAGCYVGRVFGERFQKPAQIGGGIILIGIGIKILAEHLGQGI